MTEREAICDKCGAPIETGFMFIECPHKDQCALFPHDADESVQAFARELINSKGAVVR